MRVLSPWALLGVIAAVVATLYLLFPRQSLMEKVRAANDGTQEQSGNDQLTADYIAALLRTEPADFELRMLLAERRFSLGQLALAREAMEPVMLSTDPALRRRVMLLDLRMLEAEAAAEPRGSMAWLAAQAQLRERLSSIVNEDWPPRQMLELARQARSLRIPEVAVAFERKLERGATGAPPQWLAEAAQAALGDGEYVQAARLYFSAQKRAADMEERRDYFLKGLAILRSGNLLKEALAAAEAEIGDLRDDQQTLTYLTRLALAAGDPQRAQVYVKRMLRLSQSLLPSPSGDRGKSLWERWAGDEGDSIWRAQAATELPGPSKPFASLKAPSPSISPLQGAHGAAAPCRSTGEPHAARNPCLTPEGEGRKTTLQAMVMLDQMLGWTMSSAQAAEAPPPAKPGAGTGTSAAMRPYDEDIYTLAFDVFIANGNLADAYRVAEAAVAQRPGDLAWRRKLAQAAEWSGRPQEALQQWRQIAERSGADDAWRAVLRLAPGLRDDEALLAAWTREAGRRDLTAAEWKRIAEIYESLGRPADGIAFLKAEYERRRELAILETAADLEERSGRAEDAIASLERIMKLGGNDAAHALRLATLLFLRADFARAYAVLEPQQARAGAGDQTYWKLLADLAWQLQDDATAATAYDRLQTAGKASSNDLERLVSLLRSQHPADARRMALFAWRQFHSVWAIMIALELANEQRDYADMKKLLDEIRPEDETRLAANPFYFVLRASYFQAAGERPKAMAEYRRAMESNPDSADLRLSYLWLLIDAREAKELRERLLAWSGPPHSTQPAWWDAYAAAWLALNEPRRALPWMSRQAAARAGDYLWLANYAETLEEAGQAGMAERVRRHAWLQARQRMRDDTALAAQREPMLAYARLALRNAPGDASLNVMRRLLREDTVATATQPAETGATTAAAAPEAAMDNAARELALAWTLGEERLEAAREWMWTRFARRVDAPSWADIALALAERDRDRLAGILDDTSREYPAAARIDAARELGRTRLAAELGFAAQERNPDSEDIHLRLSTDLLEGASSIIARDIAFQRGVVQGHEESIRLQAWATQTLRLAVDLGIMHQHSADGGQLTGVPGADRTLAFSALWRHDSGETEATVSARNGIASFTSLKLAHTRPLDERLSGGVALAMRDRAGESVALGVAGHKDEASATVNYRLSGREYLAARVWDARFHTQQDAYLGHGRGLSAEAGYRVRSEYPDFNVRLSRTVSRFEADGAAVTDNAAALLPGSPASAPAASFMPQSFRLWGINAGFGTDLRERRSRAVRPFADVGRTVSSTSGSGYNWLLGAGGSVLGPDHLAMYWLRARGGGIGAAVRELGLRYQLYFD